jgi:uncharacterized protein involved in exopolysaccharide biosynthesis
MEADEINLEKMWRVVWSSKLLVAGVAAVFTLAAIVYALLATPIYRAETVLVPTRDASGQGGLAGLAGRLSGLASLAGVNIDTAGNDTREHLAVLRSRNMVERFVAVNKLEPVISQSAKAPLSRWKVVRVFKEQVLEIQEDTRRGVTTVAVEWTDPRLAAAWANGFVVLANNTIRSKDVADAQRNIAYLEKRLLEVNSVEVRNLMYSLIESETKTLMLANGRIEYAFAVVDPAVVPELRVRPRRTLIAGVGLMLGLGCGVLVAFLRSNARARRAA